MDIKKTCEQNRRSRSFSSWLSWRSWKHPDIHWYPMLTDLSTKRSHFSICIINPLQLQNLYFSFKRWSFFYFPRDPTLSTFVASVQQAHVDGWDMMPKHHRTKWPILAPATLLQQEGGIIGSPFCLQITMKLRAADSINYMESYNHCRK